MEQESIVEGEVIPDDDQPSQELVVVEPTQQVTLFGTSNPAEVVQRAARVADALKDVLRRQGLTTKISGKDHVQVEGWQTVGSMVGVFPVKEWVEELPYPDPVPEGVRAQKEKGLAFGYKASYRAQTLVGAVVGGAEAECKRTEKKPWTWGDDYALRSMAQTRATSKALRSPLGFIVTMAGYSATPAEEMPQQESQDDRKAEKFGPAINKDEAEKVARALTFLTGDADTAITVYSHVEKDAGYFPVIVCRGLLHAAVALRDKNNKQQEEQTDGSSNVDGSDGYGTDGQHEQHDDASA